MRIFYRGRPWQWHVLKPLQGAGYKAYWFGPFKITTESEHTLNCSCEVCRFWGN